MDRLKSILVFSLIFILLMTGVFFYGRHQGKQAVSPPEQVSTKLILDRITSQYFLVTKTVFVDSEAEIETPKHDNWKDLFVGNKLDVEGIIRVDVGVDMKGLGAADIALDERQKTISIKLPPADILDASLYGELEFAEDQAILDKIKSFFVDDQNEDYNRALQVLVTSAKDQVASDGNLYNEARADSIKLVELIISGMLKDYRVIVE